MDHELLAEPAMRALCVVSAHSICCDVFRATLKFVAWVPYSIHAIESGVSDEYSLPVSGNDCVVVTDQRNDALTES